MAEDSKGMSIELVAEVSSSKGVAIELVAEVSSNKGMAIELVAEASSSKGVAIEVSELLDAFGANKQANPITALCLHTLLAFLGAMGLGTDNLSTKLLTKAESKGCEQDQYLASIFHTHSLQAKLRDKR